MVWENPPGNRKIDLMNYDLFPILHRPPMWPSVGPNATVVPGVLILTQFFEYEIVKLDNVCVLFGERW